jgi:Mor family transcriptional regulator
MDGRGQKFRRRGSDFIESLSARAAALLIKHAGLSPEEAAEIARDHAHDIASDMGGQLLYLARDLSFGCSKRDRKIVAKFRGDNISALAREYNLTEVRVRQILATHRMEQQASRQQDLLLG